MSKENKNEIMNLIQKDNDYKNVVFNHAYLNDDGYYLNFYYDNGRISNNHSLIQSIPIQKNIISK